MLNNFWLDSITITEFCPFLDKRVFSNFKCVKHPPSGLGCNQFEVGGYVAVDSLLYLPPIA